ncbi:MAG TPA: AtpZ/AtpI family protein [Candidatus Baltobacteraceae bacterium]|nr:AtpZ/AtpI family protein [Candidatus Baltobacteraceae bacterium]
MRAALGAGAALSGGVLAGALAGWWLAQRSGQSWWFLAGFFAGALAGGISALRLLYAAAK